MLGLARIAQAHRSSIGQVPRWWRLVVVDSDTAGLSSSIAEFQLRATIGGTSLSSDNAGTAVANSMYDSSHAAANAFDGNPATFWANAASPPDPLILAYKLPTANTINEIALTVRPDGTNAFGQGPKNFRIESSIDSTDGLTGTWKREWQVIGSTGWTSGETRVFSRTGAPTPSIWNDADRGYAVVLSNSYRTMVCTGSGYTNFQLARSTNSHTSGKFYVEFTSIIDSNGYSGYAGIASGVATLINANANLWAAAIAYPGTGAKTSLNALSTSLSPAVNFASGSIIGLAIDLDASKGWLTINGQYIVGSTYGAISNPATGANPTFTLVGGIEYFLAASSPSQNTEITLNTGQVSYIYPAPTGFSNW